MKITTLNGLSRVNIDPKLNGLSRVNMNGLSRVNMNGYTLNGYQLNGYQLNAYRRFCRQNNLDPRMNGAFSAFLAKIAPKVKGGITKIVDRIRENKANREYIESLKNNVPGAPAVDTTEVDDYFADVDERGLFSAPSLFKEPGKWFASDKVPMIQKVGVVAGAVVLVDALTGGNIILQRVGVMQPKSKKRK